MRNWGQGSLGLPGLDTREAPTGEAEEARPGSACAGVGPWDCKDDFFLLGIVSHGVQAGMTPKDKWVMR